MKPNATQEMAHVGTQTVDFKMGIDEAAMAHIMTVLTDLYSDPMMAVIREYSTNAIDSNLEAGNADPILVHLPSALDPTFSVQDHGLGLSLDEIRDVYAMYGNSTKRESDLVTGMLGLGCKSGLTYSNQFTVNSVQNGLRVVAVVTKDEKGVGAIKVLDTLMTTDPDGVTISIPVKGGDIEAFAQKAAKFFAYWTPGTVLVGGKPPKFLLERKDTSAVWLDDSVLVEHANGTIWWDGTRNDTYSRQTKAENVVVMGGVAYPFAATDPGIRVAYGDQIRHRITAWLPMGVVDFAPSREALMLTDRTEAVLRELRKHIKERFDKALTDKVKSEATEWDRTKAEHVWGTMSLGNQRGNIKIPAGRCFWQYDPRFSRASRFEKNLNFSSIRDENSYLIYGYTHRSMTPTARVRLEEFLTKNASSSTPCWILPDTIGLTDLKDYKGRPKVVSWQHVLDNTTAPVKSATARTKSTVVYQWVHEGTPNRSTGEVDPQGRDLVYVAVQEVPWKEDDSRWNRTISLPEQSKKYHDAVFVSLGEHQVEKFKRNHPQAESWKDYVARIEQETSDALTEDDKQHAHLVNEATARLLENLNKSVRGRKAVASSPLLAEARKALAHKPTPAVAQWARLGFAAPAPARSLDSKVKAAYPLAWQTFSHHHQISPDTLNDLCILIEAKDAEVNKAATPPTTPSP